MASGDMIVYHVVFSYTRGIYLGRSKGLPLWSKDDGTTGDEKAPMFEKMEEFTKIEGAHPTDVHLREVWTGSESKEAGVEDCANAGLPRWGKQALGKK